MRILRVHNSYRQRGGEDVSFESEARLLEDFDHSVYRLVVTNQDIPENSSPLNAVRFAKETIWSESSRTIVGRVIEEFMPDIVHFDNTFPRISPSAYSTCREHGVPVVQSLRNYRLLCPSANLFRDGSICEDCIHKLIPVPSLVHRCYHNSLPQTSVIAAMLAFHRIRKTWLKDVSAFIVLSDFMRQKFVDAGFPADRIATKPNFVSLPSAMVAVPRNGFVYVGRLAMEKGIATLLDAAESAQVRLSVVGDGPLRNAVVSASARVPSISWHGTLPEFDAYQRMASALAVVVPSEWYEPFGRVVIEAFATGTPVIAARIGDFPKLVDDGQTGLLFNAGDTADLQEKLRWASDHAEVMIQMGRNARLEYERRFTPERNYESLMSIYHSVLSSTE